MKLIDVLVVFIVVFFDDIVFVLGLCGKAALLGLFLALAAHVARAVYQRLG
jgi:hypothetical protein